MDSEHNNESFGGILDRLFLRFRDQFTIYDTLLKSRL